MKNPYPQNTGFGLRLYRAKRALERLGRDCLARIYTRGFDNCFEMGDGDAVVWALVEEALNNNATLKQGIQNMGKDVWPDWLRVHDEGQRIKGPALPLLS